MQGRSIAWSRVSPRNRTFRKASKVLTRTGPCVVASETFSNCKAVASIQRYRTEHIKTGAAMQIMAPYVHWDIPAIGQAYLLFRAKLAAPFKYSSGTESLETRLFAPHEIPFDKVSLH